jgi:hypothetical protein
MLLWRNNVALKTKVLILQQHLLQPMHGWNSIFIERGQLLHGPIRAIVFLSGKFSKEVGILMNKNALDAIWQDLSHSEILGYDKDEDRIIFQTFRRTND